LLESQRTGGGLGIKDLALMNLAMGAKLLWRNIIAKYRMVEEDFVEEILQGCKKQVHRESGGVTKRLTHFETPKSNEPPSKIQSSHGYQKWKGDLDLRRTTYLEGSTLPK
jgi:hypothetical protein